MSIISEGLHTCRNTDSDATFYPLTKYLLSLFMAALLISGAEFSNAEVEFSSSMNPVGSGARATGMGGAFIAVADDATAASWNPAGLIHLEKPEISFVHSYFNRSHSYNSSTHPELAERTQGIDLHDINYASIAYPFILFDRNMIVTINYQRLYDMNKSNSFKLNTVWPDDLGSSKDQISFNQKGYLGAISPAIAVQILPDLYFGATVNIWDNVFGTSNWQFNYTSFTKSLFGGLEINENTKWTEKHIFSGLNSNLGLLYTLNGKYSFGFVYKTPFTASVRKEKTYVYEQIIPDFPDANSISTSTTVEKNKIDMPASYGFGFAYRHSDNLTFAMDVYRTQWSDFAITNAEGIKKNPINGGLISEGKPKDTTQVRLGAEYLFIGDKMVIPVRSGLFYDPEPGQQKVDNYYGFSVGSGISYDKIAFDFSYQYRWGNRVSSDLLLQDVNSNIQSHTVMTSLIYHF